MPATSSPMQVAFQNHFSMPASLLRVFKVLSTSCPCYRCVSSWAAALWYFADSHSIKYKTKCSICTKFCGKNPHVLLAEQRTTLSWCPTKPLQGAQSPVQWNCRGCQWSCAENLSLAELPVPHTHQFKGKTRDSIWDIRCPCGLSHPTHICGDIHMLLCCLSIPSAALCPSRVSIYLFHPENEH